MLKTVGCHPDRAHLWTVDVTLIYLAGNPVPSSPMTVPISSDRSRPRPDAPPQKTKLFSTAVLLTLPSANFGFYNLFDKSAQVP